MKIIYLISFLSSLLLSSQNQPLSPQELKSPIVKEVKAKEDISLEQEPALEALKVPAIASVAKEEKQINKTNNPATIQVQEEKTENILDTYFIEIIGFITFILIIILYFIMKKARHNKTNDEEEQAYTPQSQEKKIVEDAYDIEKYGEVDDVIILSELERQENLMLEEQASESINMDLLAGAEEGSFGEITDLDNKEEQKQKSPKKQQSTLSKREVPSHQKISKNDFHIFKGLRVLVAEDNLINQKVISGLLGETGVEIVMANDGQEVLNILEKDSNFTFILMDAHMPIIDGFEATRIIRENPNYNHIIIVALSGDTASDDIRKMKDAGMAEHLEKPLRMDALYDVFYAYTGEQESVQEEDDSEEEAQTKNITTSELETVDGLDICGGDRGFYSEILDEFVSSYANYAKEMYVMFNNMQTQEINKMLLDITGVCANIGAKRLSLIAESLKQAINEKNEKVYLTTLAKYERHLKLLLKDIEAFKQS